MHLRVSAVINNALALPGMLRHLPRVKLALVRRNYSNLGGAELYVQRLLAALAAAGHELHIFCESWASDATATIHRITASGSRAERPRRFAENVRKAIAQQSFDCVFSLERTLQQDVYRAGDGVHRVWLERRRQFAPFWKKPFVGRGGFHRGMCELESQTFHPKNTRHIIVNSEMVKREIVEHFQFPADRIHLVRNGVDVCRFQRGNRAATRAKFGIADTEYLLLFAGSGWERKGLRFVIDALRELPSDRFKLLVVGKGKRPLNCPANVIFADPMSDLENAYAASDLFVFLPIYEPSANVCIEALAAGLPVVTSTFNGAAEIVTERVTGTTLENPADAKTVAEAIRSWESRAQRVQVADRTMLDLERNAAETLAVLERAAREKRA